MPPDAFPTTSRAARSVIALAPPSRPDARSAPTTSGPRVACPRRSRRIRAGRRRRRRRPKRGPWWEVFDDPVLNASRRRSRTSTSRSSPGRANYEEARQIARATGRAIADRSAVTGSADRSRRASGITPTPRAGGSPDVEPLHGRAPGLLGARLLGQAPPHGRGRRRHRPGERRDLANPPASRPRRRWPRTTSSCARRTTRSGCLRTPSRPTADARHHPEQVRGRRRRPKRHHHGPDPARQHPGPADRRRASSAPSTSTRSRS
jgi:hypothetical protein